jgi:hypothetical protein
MAYVNRPYKMLETSSEIVSNIIDFSKYDKMISSLEKYSIKLDKLLETTSNIEQESKRINKCR